MMQHFFTFFDPLRATCCSFASNEDGSVAYEMGVGGIVLTALATGVLCMSGSVAREMTSDLEDLWALWHLR